MLPQIGIGLAAGLAVGWVIAWALGQARQRQEKQLEQQLAEKSTALETAQREFEKSRAENRAQDKAQSVEIARLTSERDNLERDAEKAANALEEQRDEITRLRSHLLDSETERASLKTAIDAEQKSAQEKLELLANARTELSNQFKSLAGDIFEKNSKVFTDQNKSTIGDLLRPMGDALEKLRNATQELEVKREGAYEKVSEAIRGIQDTHKDLRSETAQLVQALRSPKARGNWGELQLKRCIEFAGMVEHASFDTEVFVRGEDESIRPDCVIHLPNERTIIIDAKTPFDAYLNATVSTDEAERASFLAAHASHVRTHLSQLSAKEYWKQFKDSPDFVVCFLSSEVLFSAALEKDPGLIEFGSNSNVILATPTTLIALLKAVAYGWQQMEITRNALAIKETGQKLYDKLATAQDYFSKMGRALESTVGQYNSLVGCIEGRDSVFDRARELHELGIGKDELGELKALESERSRPRILKGKDWAMPMLDDTILELAASMEDDGDD